MREIFPRLDFMWFCSESSASKSFVHILGCYPVGGIFGMVIVAILAWVIVRQEVRLIVYDEIRAYVLEHTGLKVSSLYIAQVKQKCGIVDRENYNKAKSEDAKQPQCPPEKEQAILEALRHFRMI